MIEMRIFILLNFLIKQDTIFEKFKSQILCRRFSRKEIQLKKFFFTIFQGNRIFGFCLSVNIINNKVKFRCQKVT